MKRGISQEWLKVIACITMLLDHIGAIFVPGIPLRAIGRLAFPIYCFLLAEGVSHTRSPGKYALRLLIGALIAELPFDLCLFGTVDFWHQSVMVTLLLGFCALQCMKQVANPVLKLLSAVPFVVLAKYVHCDYGMFGVLMVVLFGITRELRGRSVLQFLGMVIMCMLKTSRTLFVVLGVPITLQMVAALSIIPIALYSGEKRTNSKLLQWGFYLFYPVHLLVLHLLKGFV